MDKQIVLITSDMQNIAVIEVSHPSPGLGIESFLEDWEEANDKVYSNFDEEKSGEASTDELTVRILEKRGYIINYKGFTEVVDAG
jgi:hypothetical protein